MLKPLVEKGLKSIILFGVVMKEDKDEKGGHANTAVNAAI